MARKHFELNLRHYTAPALQSIRQVLLDVYAEVYADALDQPFATLEEFTRRLSGYAAAPGWECVIGRTGGEPVGYAFGYPLPHGARWWRGVRTPVSPADIEETGTRTFALNEIMVRAPWRGTDIARRIHDELMSGRSEERVTLLVEQTHPKVRRRYEQWGYTWFADLQPNQPYAPVLDSMIMPLHQRRPDQDENSESFH
jgi:GNAT superfamily N-acetyltransferase